MISSETKYFAPCDDSVPALVLQVTRLVNSYMLWIGPAEERPEDAQNAPLKGNLCRDWACAMPPTSMPSSATSLFRASASDVALAMAQRLARRFKKQIFLSVDLPPSFVALEAERRLVEALNELEPGGC